MTAVASIMTGPSAAKLSDLELLTHIVYRRYPHVWETWPTIQLARLAIRAKAELLVKNSATFSLVSTNADVKVESSESFVSRAFQVLLDRDPDAAEMEFWLSGATISLTEFSQQVFLSKDALVADTVIYSSNTMLDARLNTQLFVSYAQWEIYISACIEQIQESERNTIRPRKRLSTEIEVGMLLFDISSSGYRWIEDKLKVAFTNLRIKVRPVKLDQLSVSTLSTLDIFLITNYQMYSNATEIAKIVRESPTICACWHWDNHHMFEMINGVKSDFDYLFPAHSNGSLATHGGFAIGGQVTPCCVFQWTDEVAAQGHERNKKRERSNRLYGRFNAYPGRGMLRDSFLVRAKEIVDENDVMLVDPQTNTWAGLSAAERFDDVASYKAIICSSVYHDMPARFWDALLVGAIPLIPYGISDIELAFSAEEIRTLPIVRYIPNDPSSLRLAVAKAIEAFDREGETGVEKRFQTIFECHMVHHRAAKMIEDIIACEQVRC